MHPDILAAMRRALEEDIGRGLTQEEAEDRRLVFDIDLLAERLLDATAWLRGQRETTGLPIGYFGASTGAAAALVAAAARPGAVRAVVSRGGRPDLAGPDALRGVQAVPMPTTKPGWACASTASTP